MMHAPYSPPPTEPAAGPRRFFLTDSEWRTAAVALSACLIITMATTALLDHVRATFWGRLKDGGSLNGIEMGVLYIMSNHNFATDIIASVIVITCVSAILWFAVHTKQMRDRIVSGYSFALRFLLVVAATTAMYHLILVPIFALATA